MFKYILVLTLIVCTSSCHSTESNPLAIAKANFNNSIGRIDKIETQCETSEAILDKRLFSGISATNEQFKTAIFYYYFKAKTDCTSEVVKDYLLASSVLLSLDTNNKDAILESDMFIVETNIQLVKHQAAYETLPDTLKAKLSDIRALYSPFNLVRSIESLGLE